MEGLRLRQHIGSALGALLGVIAVCLASPASAAPVAALIAPLTSSMQATAGMDPSGVKISRVFEAPADSDIVSFSTLQSDATPVSGSVFGFSMALRLPAIETDLHAEVTPSQTDRVHRRSRNSCRAQ